MSTKEFIVNQKRDFGNIISDGFTFVKRTFKLQFEYFLILVLPVLLLAIFNMYFVFSDLDASSMIENDSFNMFNSFKLILGYGATIIAVMLFSYIIYSVAINYEENDNSLPEKRDVTNFMKENAIRYITYFFAMFIVLFVIVALTGFMFFVSPVIGVLLFFLLFVGAIYIVPFFSVLPVLYLKEGSSLSEAVQNTYRLVKQNWLSTFGVVIVTNIIGSFASYVLIIPIYVMMVINMLGSIDDTSGSGDDFGFYMALLMIVSIIASIIIMTYTNSATVLKYYDLKDRTDNSSIYQKIEDIGKNDNSIFENEGEF